MKKETEKDWVMICKKCGDEIGIVYESKETKYLYVYNHITLGQIFYTKPSGLSKEYIGKIKLEVEE